MSFSACLSMLEIVAYRDGEPVAGAEEHLATCVRCRALLTDLPAVQLSEPLRDGHELPRLQPRAAQPPPEELKTGQVWSATVENQPGRREIVVVLANQPPVDDNDMVLVAPVDDAFEDATDADLIVGDSPLGYRHVVNVGMQGTVMSAQLEGYLGRLEMPEREALVDIYRALFAASERTTAAATGAPLAGPDDPRGPNRAERLDALRALFAPADRLLGQELEDEDPEERSLGRILAEAISGDEWDRPSLLTAAAVDGAAFGRMLEDQLDLTDQNDVPDVQRVLNVIRLDDWRDPVRASLQRSRGGERVATGAEPAIAARSFAGISDEERERDLMGDQSSIDDSEPARQRAIGNYLQSLEKQIDDAS